jgi:NADH-quinone oxidoreductase subunit M
MESILAQSIIAPMVMSPVALAIGGRLREKTGWLAFLASLYSVFTLGVTAFRVYVEKTVSSEVYHWAPLIGNLTLLADGVSTPVALTIALLSAIIAVYSIEYMKHERLLGMYFSLYLLYEAGMIGAVLTTNLAFFFLFFELMLIPSWALIAIWGTGEKERIALKYFLFTEAGALSLLGGIAATRALTGTFEMFEIADMLKGVSLDVIIPIVTAILIGFLVKMAIFPLHTWLPDAHAEAPTPISALLSPAMIGIGGYAAIRIVYTCFPMVLNSWEFMIALSVLALITMAYGGLMAYAQDDLKRLLAYSSISQMGYMLFGVASASYLGILGSILLYVNHAFCKATLFMMSGIMMHGLGTRRISELKGLASKMPYTTVATVVSFLGLAGVPPMLGFWSELYIFLGSMYKALILSQPVDMVRLTITVIAVLTAILTAGYALWTIRRVFYGQVNAITEKAHEPSLIMLAPLMILMILTIVLGVYPTVIMGIISSTPTGL